jgi:GDP-4-dehydro-6-deoxy-D-mannose reductase
MRILLTGITGFAGGHLAEALLAQGGAQIVGVSRRSEWPPEWRHLAGQAVLHACDLGDGLSVEALVRQVQPEQVYHLAGYAHVGQSLREPEAAWTGNLTVTRCLYDAIQRWGGRPRILYVGSGQVYGGDQAHDEHSPLLPATPYASSKAAADLVSYQYTRSSGFDIVRVRPFNHIGPRQSPQFAVPNFARQVAAIEQGRQEPFLQTGNLTPRRDLTDVRDMVRAYILLMQRGRTGEVYNVGTGEAHSMQAVLDHLLALAQTKVEIRQKPDLFRATDAAVSRADASKLRRETGWRPQLSLAQTLADTLDYWRKIVHE